MPVWPRTEPPNPVTTSVHFGQSGRRFIGEQRCHRHASRDGHPPRLAQYVFGLLEDHAAPFCWVGHCCAFRSCSTRITIPRNDAESGGGKIELPAPTPPGMRSTPGGFGQSL